MEIHLNPSPVPSEALFRKPESTESPAPASPPSRVVVEDRVEIRAVGPFGECEDCEESASENQENSPGGAATLSEEEENASGTANPSSNPGQQLTPDEEKIVQQLQARDREVRAHERAHKAAAGAFAKGGPTFSYQTGPDGKRYAVGGEVKIDASPVPGNPQATITKARTIRRAATAPADPSGQDRRVASAANRMEAQARRELREEKAQKANEVQEKFSESSQSANPSNESTSTPSSAETSDSFDRSSGENNPTERFLRQFTQTEPESDTGSRLNTFI